MMNAIEIVDRGRGPQLSTNRITVQDLVPYFQQRWTYEEIREVIPVLSIEEIAVVERYVQEHYEEVTEQDRRIRERALARRKPAEVEEAQRKERLQRLEMARQSIRQPRQEANGDHATG
jgi:uncharacterized protein (DUF433 family)